MGRRVGLAGFAFAVTFAVLALAGCGASENSSGSADVAAPAPAQKPGVDADRQKVAGEAQQGQAQRGEAQQGQAQQGEAQQSGTSAQQSRQIVRNATVDLRTNDVADVLSKVKGLVIAQGGYSAQENSQLKNANVTLQVPGDKLEAVLESISALEGVEVNRRELRTEDVTDQVVDVEARLANQRASVERVRGLLERASSTSEITQIEAELTKRQSELESLQRRYETLRGQVAMSTLTVTISSHGAPAAVVVEDEPGFLDAFAGGWKALVAAFSWLLVVVGAVLPFAVVLGLPAFGYLWWRRRRKSAVVAPPVLPSATP